MVDPGRVGPLLGLRARGLRARRRRASAAWTPSASRRSCCARDLHGRGQRGRRAPVDARANRVTLEGRRSMSRWQVARAARGRTRSAHLWLRLGHRGEPHGHGARRGGASVPPRRRELGGGPRADSGAAPRARPRERPPEVAGRLGPRRVRRARPARGRVGVLRRQRARLGVRAAGRAARRSRHAASAATPPARACRSASHGSRSAGAQRISVLDVLTPRRADRRSGSRRSAST